jgi:hypothetical protein
MNAQELMKAGYSRCQDYDNEDWHVYQKKIYDSNNTLLYFINVYQYDWRKFRKDKDYSYVAKLWLYVDDKADCLNIEFGCDDYTVEELEHYVLTGLYRRLYCVPDKHND